MLILSLQPLAWLGALLLGWLAASLYRYFDIGFVRVFSSVRISIAGLCIYALIGYMGSGIWLLRACCWCGVSQRGKE